MKLLAFGEILFDVYPSEKFLGGAALNFAAHFAKLNGEAYMLSSLGNDSLGKEALSKVKEFGIDTKYIGFSKMPTGRCDVTFKDEKTPSYNLLDTVAYDYISTDNINEDFDILYFGTLALRNGYNRSSLSKLIKEKSFKHIFCDVNIRPPFYSKEVIEFNVNNATVIKISDEELNTVAASLGISYTDVCDFSKSLVKRYPNIKTVIITMGEKGAFALESESGKYEFCPAQKVSVASCVGAGDSFGASFLYDYLNGLDLKNCLLNASKLAAFVVSKLDAVPEYSIDGIDRA